MKPKAKSPNSFYPKPPLHHPRHRLQLRLNMLRRRSRHFNIRSHLPRLMCRAPIPSTGQKVRHNLRRLKRVHPRLQQLPSQRHQVLHTELLDAVRNVPSVIHSFTPFHGCDPLICDSITHLPVRRQTRNRVVVHATYISSQNLQPKGLPIFSSLSLCHFDRTLSEVEGVVEKPPYLLLPNIPTYSRLK